MFQYYICGFVHFETSFMTTLVVSIICKYIILVNKCVKFKLINPKTRPISLTMLALFGYIFLQLFRPISLNNFWLHMFSYF